MSPAMLQVAARQPERSAVLVEAVQRCGVGDVPQVMAGQARIAADLADGARRLRAAGVYPLVLAGSVVAAGAVIAAVLTPALAAGSLPVVSMRPLLVAVGGCALLLVLLAAAVLGRLRLPLMSGGWPAIHRAAFFDSLSQLTQAGAGLPEAIRASAVWCLPDQARAARAMARALEAGGSADGAPLLHPMEANLLAGAARTGTHPQAALALARQERIRQQRTLPGAILRIHTLSLLLASGGVLAVGAAFFTVYGHVITS